MRNTFTLLLLASVVVAVGGFRTADAVACPPGYEAVVIASSIQCAHPDDVPAQSSRPSSFYAAEAEARGLACFGDGSEGNRFQALYVTERSADLSPSDRSAITQGMISVQAIYRSSSLATGQTEIVPRWVHSPDCQPSIEVVHVAPGALAGFPNMIQAVAAQGYDRSDRKYIMWTDSATYCGIAAVSIDDSKIGNQNDGHHAGYARIDRPCWGYQGSVVAHEVTHTLGGVQPSAPNATPYGHCTDEYDLMCYVDGPGVATTVTCSNQGGEMLLDCNNDDYFHPDPPAGSWLYSHWNVADSSFLQRAASPTAEDLDDERERRSLQGFVDVDREGPHGRAIGWLADRGVTRGCDAGRFCPGESVTRGQMAAFLHRFVPDLAAGGGGGAFEDVPADSPFAGDIAWLASTGLTQGCGDGAFCPDEPVTRSQMAAFLYRVFAADARLPDSGFGDVSPDSPFHQEIAWLAQTGISKGCNDAAFCPDDLVTRGQMASFLYRAGQMYLDD